MAFQHVPVGPWPLGMARPERATDFPPQALADAVNVDVRPEGSVVTTDKWESVLTDSAHSLYQVGDVVYGVVNGAVGRFDIDGFTALGAVDGPLWWTEVAGIPYFCDRSHIAYVDDGLHTVSLISDWQDGDDVLVDMPAGRWLSYWNGRLVVAKAQTLLFSQPLRYGAHNPVTDYVQIGQRIEFVATLETGIYVGTPDRVLWLEGATPSDFRVRRVAGSFAAAAAVVGGDVFGKPASTRFAVFFSQSGFAVGDAQGIITYPQAERFKDIPLFPGRLVVSGTRLFFVRS